MHYNFLHLYNRVVRFLVHKYPPSLTHMNSYSCTPLHLAANSGKTEVAGFLINEGAKVDARWEVLWRHDSTNKLINFCSDNICHINILAI